MGGPVGDYYPWEDRSRRANVLDASNHLTVAKKDLTAMRVSDSFTVSGSFLRDAMSVEIAEDYILEEIGRHTVLLESYVLQEHLAQTYHSGAVEFLSPQTTWQMFKHTNREKWWLRWLVERRPVVYEVERKNVTVQVKHSYIYPEANVSFPNLGRPRKFEVFELQGGIQ